MPVRLKSSLNLEIKIRPDPNSAFKRFSHPLPFAYPPRRTVREWREKSEGNDAISVYFSH
jgi:hypothetical protein